LKEASINSELRYYQLTMGGCLPLSNYFQLDINDKFNQDCIIFNSAIKDAIYRNSKEIEVIVVSAAWLLYLEGDNYFKDQSLSRGLPALSTVRLSIDGFTALSQRERQESFDKYVSELFMLLASKSKKLVVVGPAPPVLVNFTSRKSFSEMKGVNSGQFKMNSINFDKIIERNSKVKFSYIDISKALCAQETCLSRDQYGSFYADTAHFSDYGQHIIIKPLIEGSISKK
jgi:hypothetical protein